MTKPIKDNKGCLVFLLLIILGYLLYAGLGHLLVKAIYDATGDGRPIGIPNSLIKYQHRNPIEHYYNLADRTFYEIWFLFGVAPLLFVTLRKIFFPKHRFETMLKSAESGSTGDTSFRTKYSYTHIIIIFFLSLGIRFVFLLPASDLLLTGDEWYYWAVPKRLAEGQLGLTVLRPPLWGYMLAIPRGIFDDPIAGRALTSVIGACTPILIYLLGARVFNKRTGLLAGLLYTFYPTHIGYSHYLWSEVLFSFLCLLSTFLFFHFVEDKQRTKYLFLSFFVAGIALLSKEFAVVLFAGLAATLLFLKTKHKIRKILMCCSLFFLPVFLYSFTLSCITKRVVILSDAPMVNFRQAIRGGGFADSFRNQKELSSEIIDTFKNKSIYQTFRDMKRQIYNLWTPNSFPIVRLLSIQVRQKELWSYGVSKPRPWAYLIAGGYILIVSAGLIGLCLADNKAFKIFSIVNLICLSATSVLALLCSRFRLPFMFIFVIFAAHLLVNGKYLIGNPKNTKRVLILLILLRIFVSIVNTKLHTLGQWG